MIELEDYALCARIIGSGIPKVMRISGVMEQNVAQVALTDRASSVSMATESAVSHADKKRHGMGEANALRQLGNFTALSDRTRSVREIS
jgi:hypothetical protein